VALMVGMRVKSQPGCTPGTRCMPQQMVKCKADCLMLLQNVLLTWMTLARYCCPQRHTCRQPQV